MASGDTKVEELLDQWNFPELKEVFEHHAIDHEALLDLSELSVASLIPLIGKRTKFLKRLNAYRKQLQQASTPLQVDITPPESITGSTLSAENSDEDPDDDLHGDETVNDNAHSDDGSHLESDDESETVLDLKQLQKKANPNDVEKALLRRRTEAARVLANYPKSSTRQAARGKVKKFSGLDHTHRKLLCDILVKEDLAQANRKGCTARVGALASQIQEVFPKERKATYFIPHKTLRKDGRVVKRVNARGLLYNKYFNYVKLIKKEGIRDTTPHSDISIVLPEISETVTQSLAWLDKRVLLCQRVPVEWAQTRPARIAELRNQQDDRNCNYLHTYVHAKYPFLKQPTGYSLLVEDFDALYPESKNLFFASYDSFKSKLRALANIDERQELSDAEVFYLLGPIFEEEGVNSVPVAKKWRAGTEEMLQSFLYRVDRIDDIQTELEAVKGKAALHKTKVQPFAIIVGGNLKNITDHYIWYDGVQHRVDSTRDAIDITFKVIHALHANYPRQSECFWMLLQKSVYQLTTQWDQPNAAVDCIIEKFSRL